MPEPLEEPIAVRPLIANGRVWLRPMEERDLPPSWPSSTTPTSAPGPASGHPSARMAPASGSPTR